MSVDLPDGLAPGSGGVEAAGAPGDGFAPTAVPGSASPDAETVVADAMSALDGLDQLPPAEHVERFEHVHDVLRSQLNGDA